MEPISDCQNWVNQKQTELESSPFGSNLQAVLSAFTAHRELHGSIQGYRRNVDKTTANAEESQVEAATNLRSSYQTLLSLAKKKGECFQTISKIATLQQAMESLSLDFDTTSVRLVNQHEHSGDDKQPKLSTRSAQACVFALRESWNWIADVVKCVQVHMDNASTYHQFYHEIAESEFWMRQQLNEVARSFSTRGIQGDRQDVNNTLKEMKALLTLYLQWQDKTDQIFEKSKKVVPVKQRVEPLKEPRPIHALCDYKTDEIEIKAGEDLTLLDNSQSLKWRVRNSKAVEVYVPALINLIPGPDYNAQEVATRLRLQFLAIWTGSLKKLGKHAIALMLVILRDWDDNEILGLRRMTPEQKDQVVKILKVTEETFKHWQGYAAYDEVVIKINKLRQTMELPPDNKTADDALITTVIVQLSILEQLMKRYQDFWTYWESYKVIVETLRQPKHILMVESWDQLNYISSAHYMKFWDTSLAIDKLDEEIEVKKQVEEQMFAVDTTDLSCGREEMTEDVQVTVQKEETATEEVVTSQSEEKKTFTIEGVQDPNSGEEIAFQKAIMLGIINKVTGCYHNSKTGEEIPIPQAINDGLIRVGFTTAKKTQEKITKSVGLITIKTTKETRPYTITGAVDAETGKVLSLPEAIKQGIMNEDKGVYKSNATGEEMLLADAIDAQLLVVEFDDSVQITDPEVITKTYAIHGVVDQKAKDKITFHEAVTAGILEKETGAYIHNVTGERFFVADAIMRGFIKGKICDDPNSLDIEPENKMFVEKVNAIKNKMKALGAFGKKTGKKAGKKGKRGQQNGS